MEKMIAKEEKYYLCFLVNKLPDLTLTKYSVFDGSSVDDVIDKHSIFLRQLHRLGKISRVYFHLLYYYNPSPEISRGRHLTILFYATADQPEKLEGIREFLITSVLSTFYDFRCFDISSDFDIVEREIGGSRHQLLELTTVSGEKKLYGIGGIEAEKFKKAKDDILSGAKDHITCEVASDADAVVSLDQMPVDSVGRIVAPKRFSYGAFLTKREYILTAQNRTQSDSIEGAQLYSILAWEPNESGRLYNVLKLMEGYDSYAVLRVDLFPVDETVHVRNSLPYQDTRTRIADRGQGKDDNSENIIKTWDKYLDNIVKFPQFYANVVAFADSQDQAVMLADSVAAEAVESGTYLVEKLSDALPADYGNTKSDGNPFGGGMLNPFMSPQNDLMRGMMSSVSEAHEYDMYFSDTEVLRVKKDAANYVAQFLSLYTLEELRPMFSFPILYPGENIERNKETDPVPFEKVTTIDSTGTTHEVMSLGVSQMGYDVTFPLDLFKKHAFIAGVPGAGKTNTMLYLVTTLWRDTEQHIPFLVLEPAKQEYRALTQISGMEDLMVFSPGADTYFPLHINPFEFPVGLTLAEHIANLNAVFAGAFELPPPSPHFIDSCIEKVYVDKGWNVNERNDGTREYPTLQELYNSLEVAVKESHYQGETLGNLQSVLEVRIGSLLKREIGNVYNVSRSIIEPEEWLKRPIIIELEALGEGPANFMSLLISTLIREVLKIRKISGERIDPATAKVGDKKEVQHIIFYEEAHNLIGPQTESPDGISVNPKISATKYLVKMLAEVRALGEGIVIADQLPTVMAPEVLKNTGLKIGHRITAQDDRGLLGSTMSASPDQLEEQGTFATGEALIFYEGLLKPFKMRMHEWEKGVSKSKYDSPSNLQMVERLRDTPIYQDQLRRSAAIMQDKMKAEFEVARKKAVKEVDEIRELIVSIDKTYERKELSLRKKMEATYVGERNKADKESAALDLDLNNKKKDLETIHAGRIIRICREFDNFFEAYMTLSNNYAEYADDMRMCAVNNYLSLFNILYPVLKSLPIAAAAHMTTEHVCRHLDRTVSYHVIRERGTLHKHDGYIHALTEATSVLCLEYEAGVAGILKELKEKPVIEMIRSSCEKLNQLFTKYYENAKTFQSIYDLLDMNLRSSLENENITDYLEKEALQKKREGLEELRNRLYVELVQGVANFFAETSFMRNLTLRHLIFETQQVRNDVKELVNYRKSGKEGLLAEDRRFDNLKKTLEIVAIQEMWNVTYRVDQDFEDTIPENLPEEKYYNYLTGRIAGAFDEYSSIPVSRIGYKEGLCRWFLLAIRRLSEIGAISKSLIYSRCEKSAITIENWITKEQLESHLNKEQREALKKDYEAFCALKNAD